MTSGYIFHLEVFRTAVLASLFVISFSVRAQDVNTQTSIYIPAGLNVYVPGSITSTKFIQNNGSLFIAGNWSNSGVYQGTGVISLEGTDQVLTNNDQTFEQLIINGGGTKTILKKIIIGTSIEFNEGIVHVDDADTLFLANNCKVKGGSSLSYVDGPLTISGSGDKVFPIGKNGHYNPTELTDVKGSSPVIAMEVEQDLPAIMTDPASQVLGDIYWTRKTISGSFVSSPINLAYSLGDTVNIERIAIAEGSSLSDPFTLLQNVSVQNDGAITVIGSRKDATGKVFVISDITSDPVSPFYLSTTLSPNAANPNNKVIKIFGDGITDNDFHFEVFNRWGILLFESQSLQAMKTTGWDGRQSGTFVASGAYPFSLRYRDASGVGVRKKGLIIVVQ